MDGGTPYPDAVQGAAGDAPSLTLDGYTGPLDHLMALARMHRVDLAGLSLPDMCDQLTAAVGQAGGSAPLGQRAAWLVMGAWLLQLRSRLLLPADEPARGAAGMEANRLRDRLAGLRHTEALASWLDRRPQLGRDVFARGAPDWEGPGWERPGWEGPGWEGPGWEGPVGSTEHQVDVIEFLWAAMALFDAGLPAAETGASHRLVRLDLHSVADARERIRRILAGASAPATLGRLLPEPVTDAPQPGPTVWAASRAVDARGKPSRSSSSVATGCTAASTSAPRPSRPNRMRSTGMPGRRAYASLPGAMPLLFRGTSVNQTEPGDPPGRGASGRAASAQKR